MNVRLIVPRRAGVADRDRIWAFCRAYWERELPEWPIVEGDHLDGPFNRSAAINRGAEGEWDLAVILDADVIVDPDTVREAVTLADEEGQLVLPYTSRWLVGGFGTRKILDGDGQCSWERWATRDRNRDHVSSCVVVPRAVWDAVHGFDERHVGWGAEDDSFHAACKTIAGVTRLPGVVWHLHHQPSPWRDHQSALYRAACALSRRYTRTTDYYAVRALLAENRGPDQVVVVCLTNGKRDTLAKTIHSADQMLAGPIGRRLIVGDGCAPGFDGWATVKVAAGTYTKAVSAAFEHAVGSGQPWVFFLEDDFVFNRPVDLCDLQAAMEAEPRLAQMVLKRQAWYPEEIAAGGLIEERTARGDRFAQRSTHLEHWAFWSQNPMLCRRGFLADHPWPKGTGSENRFARQLFDSDIEPICGMWGQADDPPLVTHIGVERAGKGY